MNDDLISRQALMKEFSDFVRASNNSDFERVPTWNDAVSLVGSMPSAEKHGRWELKKYKLSKGGEIAYYQCSCCNHATWTIDGWMYCPYCGAKMERKEE